MGETGRGFEKIWRDRRDHLWRVAWLICGNDDMADDVVAAAIARSWRTWDKRGVNDPDAYLRRAVVNEATDRFRRARRDRRWLDRRTGEGRGRRPLDDHVADRADLAAALARLPVGQRAVVVLRYWADLSVDATADALGLSPGTVKSRTSRALDDLVTDHDRRFTRRRRFLVGAAAAAALTGGGLTWGLDRIGDRPERQRVTAGPTATTGRRRSTGWERIEPAPLSPRSSPAVVWAGDRLIVWGGTGGVDNHRPRDGAAWNPAAGTWSPIASAPAEAIDGGFAVWDGAEMLVGVTDGVAAYDPATDAWRSVAPLDAEPPVGPARQAVVLDGALLVAVVSARPGAVGDEDDVVLVDLATGERTAVEPGPYAASPYQDPSGEVSLSVVGDLVVATPNWDRRPWVLDVTDRTWQRAPAPPSPDSFHFLPAIALGDRAILFESSGARLWIFDPTADVAGAAWRAGAPQPPQRPQWRYEPVWSGRELFLPGASYDPVADTWRPVAPPPRGANRQRALQARWTGDALVLFGGEEYTCPDGASCDRFVGGPDVLDGWILFDP